MPDMDVKKGTATSAGHLGNDTTAPSPVGGVAVGPSCCSQLGRKGQCNKGLPSIQTIVRER
jgi:hypothetical protein